MGNAKKSAQRWGAGYSFLSSLSPLSLLILFLTLNLSCGSKPTDLRALVPAESLVYLETNDLGAALQPIVDSKPFLEVAKSKPDLSALKGVQLAVAVTGFETSEEKLTDEHSVGRIQPHFVAVADTHAWNFQAVAFAEKKLGSFVANIYDSEPTLERSDKNGGKYFTWSSKDGRKAYALVIDSIIYFANDATAIDKCLAVRRGEADSIAKAGKVQPADPATLASGYVGPDGIAQIASLVGLKFASEAGEESEIQSAIAGIVPQLIRGSITDVSWTMAKTEQGIEDKYHIGMPPEIASVFVETMAPSDRVDLSLLDILPPTPKSVSVYNLKDPQAAWRSFVLTAQKISQPAAWGLIGKFAGILFEPYGIRDPDQFLTSIRSPIVTAQLDESGEKPLAIANISNPDGAKRSIIPEVGIVKDEDANKQFVFAEGDLGVSYIGDRVHLGDANGVIACVSRETSPSRKPNTEIRDRIGEFNSSIVTAGSESNSAGDVVSMLDEKKKENTKAVSTFRSETRFTKTGIERKTTSDFGLIGSIIAQLNDN